MKKLIFFLILFLYPILLISQDIVYDPMIGNKEYWRGIKVGPTENILNTYFQNQGIISKSKILMAAGLWDGMVENVDYTIIPIEYDTIVFEFKSDESLNLNVYKYQYDETYFFNFIGLRKANLGDDMFTGKYLFICPIPNESEITVYKGIGNKRKEFLKLNGNEITQNSYIDYEVPNEITFKVLRGQKKLMHAIVKSFVIDEQNYENRVAIWPNPVRNILHIKILENPGLVLKIYTLTGLMKYESPINSEMTDINLSSYASGTYILVFTDVTNTSILYTVKIIKR
mgnify:CR=1 FL=1